MLNAQSINIYAISISAEKPLKVEGEQMGFEYYHKPGLVPAESMDHAAESARKQVFAVWPGSEGWEGHQAVIIPVTNQFCELYERASLSGVIGSDHEEAQQFRWSSECD